MTDLNRVWRDTRMTESGLGLERYKDDGVGVGFGEMQG